MPAEDRRSMLTDRRHIAAALAVALLVQAVSLGAVGFAAAGAPREDLPDTLRLPVPHVGDRGVCEVTVVEAAGEQVRPLTDNRTWMEFEWLEDQVIRDHRGQQQLVHRLHDILYQWDDDERAYTPRPAVSEIDSRTWREVGYTYEDDNRSVERDPDGGSQTSQRSSMQRYIERPDGRGSVELCGMLNRFQGREVPLDDGPLRIGRGGCNGPGFGRPDLRFEPVGVQTIAGYRTVMFTSEQDGLTTHVWLSPELPYPVRLAFEDRGSPWASLEEPDDPEERAARNASGGEVFHVVRLTRFERGQDPIRLREDVEEDPLDPVEMGPRHRYGPDESGIDHPFPLSRAFEEAGENETVASFLESHPAAYMWDADYQYETDDGSTEHRWYLSLDGGDDGLRVQVARTTEPVVDAGPLPPVSSVNETRVEIHNVERYHYEGAPPREMVPDRVPTVASVMDWWRAYRGDAYADAAPNAWGFTIRCNHAGCTAAEVEVSAGFHHDQRRTDAFPPGGDEVQQHRRSLLTVDGSGRAVEIYEYKQRYEWTDEPAPPAGSGDGSRVAGARLSVPIWSFPAEHAAAIGVLGALAALLYWAWPALKTLPLFPFHTRLERDELLDHPLRRRIMEAIRDEPGIHRAGVAGRLDAAESTVRHHLDKLRSGGLVTTNEDHGFVCYFPRGEVDARLREALPVLLKPGPRKVLQALIERPGRSNKELSEATGLSPSTVHHHVQRLREAGLVEGQRRGRTVQLSPTDVAEDALAMRAG